MGGSEDETTDAPAWLSRAAARYGGLDELAEELGSERREHVSERGVDEVLETALEADDPDADASGPAEVVADHGVDDVFAEIEAAAPDPDVGTTEERSSRGHPVLDTGPDPAFDSLAGGPDREVVEDDVDDLFEEFEEDDPAEVAAAADPEATADDSDGGATDTPDAGTAETTGAAEPSDETDDLGEVPADLFDDLAAAVEDTTGDGQADSAPGEAVDAPGETVDAGSDGDLDVFEWVETASSPMTGGETVGTPEETEDAFDSLAEDAEPAPTDVLDDAGDETTEGEADTDTPIGAWEYDPERGLHVDTGDETTEEGADGSAPDAGEPGRERAAADAPGGADDANSPVDGVDTPDDALVGPEHAPDDLDGAAGSDGNASGRETPTPATPGGDAGGSPTTEGSDAAGSTSGEDRSEETVLDAADLGVDDPDHPAEEASVDAVTTDGEDDTLLDAGLPDTDDETRESDAVDPAAEGPETRETEPETTTGPDALDGVADGPEEDGVIGRVRSFIGRLLP